MKSDVVVPAEQQTGRGGAVCKLERSYDVRSGSKPEAKTYFNVLNLRKNIKSLACTAHAQRIQESVSAGSFISRRSHSARHPSRRASNAGNAGDLDYRASNGSRQRASGDFLRSRRTAARPALPSPFQTRWQISQPRTTAEESISCLPQQARSRRAWHEGEETHLRKSNLPSSADRVWRFRPPRCSPPLDAIPHAPAGSAGHCARPFLVPA